MKKLIIRLFIVLVVLVILGGLAVRMFFDQAIKAGVEKAGPKLLGVDVKLDAVSLSLLSGKGSVKGLFVANPSGFKAPSAIHLETASLQIEPLSVFSDKVVVKSLRLESPDITFETDLRENNLSKILSHLKAATSGNASPQPTPGEPPKPAESSPAPQSKPGKKLQVDDLLITGGRIHVSITTLGGQATTVKLKDIHLQNLGQGPEGVTSEELTRQVLELVQQNAVEATAPALADIAKGALYIPKDLRKADSNAVDKVSKGIGDFFKKK